MISHLFCKYKQKLELMFEYYNPELGMTETEKMENL